jgi:hypothetical protein
MEQKKDNNLVCVEYPDTTKKYFTSVNRAARHINANPAAVEYALKNSKMATDVMGGQWNVYITDGGNILYKDINN